MLANLLTKTLHGASPEYEKMGNISEIVAWYIPPPPNDACQSRPL